MLVERYEGLNMISVSKTLKNLKYIKEWFEKNDVYDQQDWKAMDMAIRALEAQLHLNMYRDFDVCEWQEDYDWDENNISEYHSVASVNDFLIDELKGEEDED
jgi:DNA/RNA endonuclease G (NUC1)